MDWCLLMLIVLGIMRVGMGLGLGLGFVAGGFVFLFLLVLKTVVMETYFFSGNNCTSPFASG